MNAIIEGNCVDVMRELNVQVDLTVTSPPYDDMRNYHSCWSQEMAYEIIEALYYVTKKGGVVVWIVGDSQKDFNESLNSFRQAIHAQKIGFNVIDTMIYMKNGRPIRGNSAIYAQIFEYMFIFGKGKPKTINLIRDVKNSNVNKVSGTTIRRNKDGVFKGDKNMLVKEYSRRGNIWTYGTGEKIENPLFHEHPAIFPSSLARDHILSWSNPGDLVLDPMCGSGTTCAMAKKTGRRYLGIDISEEYCDLARERIKQQDKDLFGE